MKKNKICGILHIDENASRLKPLTDSRPIAGLPFACRYRLIDFPLSSMTNAGIDTIAIHYGAGARSIYDHVRGGQEWNINPLHGGIFSFNQAESKRKYQKNPDKNYYKDYIDFVNLSKAEYVVVMGSDKVCNIDLNALADFHMNHESQITSVYTILEETVNISKNELLMNAKAKGMEEEASSIAIKEKDEAKVDVGIYILDVIFFKELLETAFDEQRGLPLLELLKEESDHYSVNEYRYEGYYNEIQTINDYYEANMDMLNEKKFNELFSQRQKIYSKVKNEMPTYYSASSSVKKSQLGTGCYIEGEINNSMIFRYVSVEEGAKIEDSIVMQGTKIGSGAYLKNVILDKNVKVGPNVVLVGSKEEPLVIGKNQEIIN